MLNVRLPLDPKMFILGLYPPALVMPRNKQILMNMSLLQAKRSVALLCKSTQRPQVGQWLRETSNCYAMERVTYILKRKGETFEKIWSPFTQLLGTVSMSALLQRDDSGSP